MQKNRVGHLCHTTDKNKLKLGEQNGMCIIIQPNKAAFLKKIKQTLIHRAPQCTKRDQNLIQMFTFGHWNLRRLEK